MEHHDKEADFVAEGWHKLDPKLTADKPPKIAWGDRYKMWPDAKKIKYLIFTKLFSISKRRFNIFPS